MRGRRQPPGRQDRAPPGDRRGRRSGAALRIVVVLGARGSSGRASSPGDGNASAAGGSRRQVHFQAASPRVDAMRSADPPPSGSSARHGGREVHDDADGRHEAAHHRHMRTGPSARHAARNRTAQAACADAAGTGAPAAAGVPGWRLIRPLPDPALNSGLWPCRSPPRAGVGRPRREPGMPSSAASTR